MAEKKNRPTIEDWRDPKFRAGYSQGIIAAASYVTQWDATLAPLVNGKRFSDIIIWKFNLLKLKGPRKVKRGGVADGRKEK